MKRPHFEINPVGSHFGLKTKAVEKHSDCADNDEPSPRDGPQCDHEQRDTSEKYPDPRLAKPLYFTKMWLSLDE